VEGWFYSTVTPGTNSGPVLLSTNTASTNPTYAKALTVNISSTTQIVVDSNGAAQQAFDFAETMLINTWYYVAVTRDSSGYIQAWLGKDGDANATASTTGRRQLTNDNWNLTGLSNCIGAFVPAGRYTTGYISNLRVGTTALYATDAATIPVPTEAFTELASTVFLQNDDTLTDQTGTQTLTAVGSAAGNEFNPFDYNGPVLSNLSLYLDAGNTASYPGTGTTWTDLSGNSRNATLTDVTYTADNSGALVFNGSTSIGIINDTVINRYTNNFSVEVWYTSNNNTPRVLRTGQSSSGFNLGSYTTVPTKWKVTKYGVVDLNVGSIPQNTSWHQVVLVYSSTGGTKVYVDGALSETNANTAAVRAAVWTYLEVGRSEAGSHNGKLGIVRYYNAVLSDADVLQNFDANKSRYGL
jgi:hypothetical protein